MTSRRAVTGMMETVETATRDNYPQNSRTIQVNQI